MKDSTHQHILQICAQLEASSLPISVGLVKAKSTSTIPLPLIIKSINAYKGGERVPASINSPPQFDQNKQTDTPEIQTDLASLVKIVQQQQKSITELQEQVAQLQKMLSESSKTN